MKIISTIIRKFATIFRPLLKIMNVTKNEVYLTNL